jgi:hypothetical protein
MKKEIWKFYKETYNSRWGKRIYEVSNEGNVKVNGVLQDFSKYKDKNIYLRIGHFLIHRAVAELFIPNPENKPFVDHIDTNINNNRADNLRWVTAHENMMNSITRLHNSAAQTGLQSGNKNPMYGKRNNLSPNYNKRTLTDGVYTIKLSPKYWGEYIDNGFYFKNKRYLLNKNITINKK